MKIGKRDFQIGKATYIMGILNVTPDSFSDGGKFDTVERAVAHAAEMVSQGADILDVGGESTRPGHSVISDKEEIQRVVPVILALKEKLPDIPISIDSYKLTVCKEAIAAGADFMNDIWGFKQNVEMAKLAGNTGLPCCLMHNKKDMVYNQLLPDFLNELSESIEIALENGVKPEQIILDPGIGFGKTYEQNLSILNHMELIKERFPDYPLLLGTSRKSVIGNTLQNIPPHERVIGTVATTVIGVTKRCDFVRVHDVLENKQAALMADAILRKPHGTKRSGK